MTMYTAQMIGEFEADIIRYCLSEGFIIDHKLSMNNSEDKFNVVLRNKLTNYVDIIIYLSSEYDDYTHSITYDVYANNTVIEKKKFVYYKVNESFYTDNVEELSSHKDSKNTVVSNPDNPVQKFNSLKDYIKLDVSQDASEDDLFTEIAKLVIDNHDELKLLKMLHKSDVYDIIMSNEALFRTIVSRTHIPDEDLRCTIEEYTEEIENAIFELI